MSKEPEELAIYRKWKKARGLPANTSINLPLFSIFLYCFMEDTPLPSWVMEATTEDIPRFHLIDKTTPAPPEWVYVSLPYDAYHAADMEVPCMLWCVEHTTGQWGYSDVYLIEETYEFETNSRVDYRFYFEHRDEAILFKLRWCGEDIQE